MADEREVLVEVKNLEVTYGSGRKAYKAVKNANFTIYKGETFGLVGESGSGKTTIGRAIMRILPTSGGEVFYKGQKINGKISHALDKQVIKEIQMIFQDPQSSLNERAKVSYIVGEGLMNVRPDLSAAERDEKVRQALLDVGLLPACVETCVGGARMFGDINDVEGEFARVLKEAQPQLKVLKPELDTAPRVFYIGLDERFSGKVEGGGTLWKPRNLQSSAHG